MSAVMGALPVELKLEIIEHLYQSHGSGVTPIMSPGATWEQPPFLSATGNDDAKPVELTFSEQETSSGAFSPLKSLRLVSRELCSLSTPYAFRDLHLDHDNIHAFLKLDQDLEAPPTMRLVRKNARSIRIILSPLILTPLFSHINGLAMFIDRLPIGQVNTIALYYNFASGDRVNFFPLTRAICKYMESGSIQKLGLYSSSILQGGTVLLTTNFTDGGPLAAVLRAIIPSTATRISRGLERLDLAIEWIPAEYFDLLRTKCTGLRTLNVRNTFRYRRFRQHWKSPPDLSWWWSTCPRLTTLRLVKCHRPDAKHMVYLLRFFPALRELVWATCGTRQDPIPSPPHPEDKTDYADGVVGRRPLDCLFLEHALEWELVWMARIPAHNVVVTHQDESRLLRALVFAVEGREEMFPGLIHLQVMPLPTISAPSSTESSHRDQEVLPGLTIVPPECANFTLDDICARRKVRLSRDAEFLRGVGCSCCQAPEPTLK